jgi:hypothetical protein
MGNAAEGVFGSAEAMNLRGLAQNGARDINALRVTPARAGVQSLPLA